MFSVRRYIVYVAISASLLYTLNYFFHFRTFQYRAQYGYAPQHDADAASADLSADSSETVASSTAPFLWSSIPTRFPVSSFLPLPTARPVKLPTVQHSFDKETAEHAGQRKQRQAAVRDTFERSWKAYRQKAWMHDQLSPLSGGFSDPFGGWAATLVDNLDTLWIMGFKADFEQAVRATMNIDISAVKIETVNVFETTIRHLGGLLAAYDLSGDKRLLSKAKDFGAMLYKAFDTPNRMPMTRWPIAAAASGRDQEATEKVLLAEIGSLSMEFTRLSQITGDSKWYDAVHRISLMFAAELKNTHLPGMFPVSVGAKNMDMTSDTWFTLNGMSDSFYEYLPKMYALLGGVEPVYSSLYLSSAETAIKHTLFRPMVPDNADILFSGAVRANTDGVELSPSAQHLGCFTGGMFALGGKLLDERPHVEIGRKLTDGCVWAYRAMPMGIMTESFTMMPCNNSKECTWDEKAWRDVIKAQTPENSNLDAWIAGNRLPKGFTGLDDRKYHLRPEAIESVFVLYRITGDEKLLDVAWDMYTAIMKATTTDLANAALTDVTFTYEQLGKGVAGGNQQFDSMESFWMAETLKYFYLIFSETDVLDLDKWVFNTEAHPFRRPLPS